MIWIYLEFHQRLMQIKSKSSEVHKWNYENKHGQSNFVYYNNRIIKFNIYCYDISNW